MMVWSDDDDELVLFFKSLACQPYPMVSAVPIAEQNTSVEHHHTHFIWDLVAYTWFHYMSPFVPSCTYWLKTCMPLKLLISISFILKEKISSHPFSSFFLLPL